MISHSKKLVVNGNKVTTLEDYAPVHKRTRAGSNGKLLMCPHCGSKQSINNFSWSTLECVHCQSKVSKYDWMVDQTDTWRTPK
mgnify:FL=1|tara:strand:+ start:740 stop:988 length:249 start_codon:yes stop_codon:yes gene_type:complete